MRLADISSAAEATGWMSPDDFRSLTHIRGRRNGFLADPQGHDPRNGRYLERRSPMPLDAEVSGDFLTLDYCGHGPWAILEDHDSLEALERAILSGAGVLNTFTTFMLAFINGRLRQYEVRDRHGHLLASHGSFIPGSTTESHVHPNDCRIVWL
jgi:hypothetical protein